MRWPPGRPSDEPLHDLDGLVLVEVLEMTLATHMVAAVAAAGIAASGAWWVQGQRYGLQVEQLKHQQTGAQLAGARQAVANMAGYQKGLTDALDTFRTTQQRNQQAQQDLGRLLLDLRGTTAGLRGDFAGLPDRIASAAQPALAEYASTCTSVFERMAERGERLAQRGAAIAAAADGHAADAVMMRQAWPKKVLGE
jgi:hypothetical protein